MNEAPIPAYHNLYEQQRQYFESGKTKSYTFRQQQLRRLKNSIQAHETLITEALFQD